MYRDSLLALDIIFILLLFGTIAGYFIFWLQNELRETMYSVFKFWTNEYIFINIYSEKTKKN